MCIRDRLYTYYEENAINQKQSAQMSIMGFFCVAFSDIKSDTNLKNDIEKKYSNNEIIFQSYESVSYTHLRAHETVLDLVCRLLLDKKK